MKNKRIYFDDRFYWTIFSFGISIGSLILFVVYIEELPIWGNFLLATTFSLFLAGIFMFPKMGLSFNYKLKRIKYIGQYKIKKSCINMEDVVEIKFFEIPTPRKKYVIFTPREYTIFNKSEGLDYIYRNGKIFKFIIFLVNGEIIEIPYFNLFKVFSKRRVENQKIKIITIINEFNKFNAKSQEERGLTFTI